MSIKKAIVFAFTLLTFTAISKAAPQESDLRSKTIMLHSTWTVAAITSTNTILVSLSSSTVWPNPTNQTGYINVTHARITYDKLTTSSCTAKIGVVTYVDTSTGSVKYFFSAQNGIGPASTNSVTFENDNSLRNLKVIPATPNSGFDGTTPYFISNDILSGSTLIRSSGTVTMLPAVNVRNGGFGFASFGNATPGLGDIILSINNLDATNSIGVIVDLLYHYDSR